MSARRTPIRSLRADDPAPAVEPRRYYNREGYVRLRWFLPDVTLECYEHRWVMRSFDPALQVHHRNGVKDDNRPENLEIVTPQEHGVEHRVIDREQAKALYATGLSIPAVGRAMGHHHAAIYRVLVEQGVAIRPGYTYRDTSYDDVIRRLRLAGVPNRRIAQAIGKSGTFVGVRVRAWGLPVRRDGRPTNDELAEHERLIADLLGAA